MNSESENSQSFSKKNYFVSKNFKNVTLTIYVGAKPLFVSGGGVGNLIKEQVLSEMFSTSHLG